MDGWGMGRGAVNWKMIEKIRVPQIDEQESLIKENEERIKSRLNSWPQLWKFVVLKDLVLSHEQCSYFEEYKNFWSGFIIYDNQFSKNQNLTGYCHYNYLDVFGFSDSPWILLMWPFMFTNWVNNLPQNSHL